MNFRVGQRVVCVDDVSPLNRWWPGCSLECGRIYTVRGLKLTHEGFPGVLLEEKVNIIRRDGEVFEDTPYKSRRFRPAVEPDISVFTAALTKTRKENLRLAKRPRPEPAVKEDA